MRKLLLIAAVFSSISSASVIIGAKTGSAEQDVLSFGQQIKIAQIITRQTPPLANVHFPVAVGSLIPAEIRLQTFPQEAQAVAPRLQGFGYIVVEEMIAIADQQSRKIVLVFPRWG